MRTNNSADLNQVSPEQLIVRPGVSRLRRIFWLFLSSVIVAVGILWIFAVHLDFWQRLSISAGAGALLTVVIGFPLLRKMHDSYWSDTSQILWILLVQGFVLCLVSGVALAKGSKNPSSIRANTRQLVSQPDTVPAQEA